MFRLRRRDVGLMALTALVCFAVAIPLTEAAAEKSPAAVIVPLGGTVTFAGMGWTCDNSGPTTGTDLAGKIVHDPPAVGCYHVDPHMGIVGVWTLVTRNRLVVRRCTPHVRDCPRLGRWAR